MPFGKISHHKNLGDPDYDFYDRYLLRGRAAL